MKQFAISNKGEKFVFSVDDEDVPIVRAYKWRARRFRSGIYIVTGPDLIRLHQVIMGDPPSTKHRIDHKDRDTMNNCKSNLRWSAHQENMANGTKYKNGKSSRFKGVSKSKSNGRWRAKAGQRPIGYFHTEQEAAKAYDRAAIELYGEFACTNEMLGLY